MTIIGGVRGVLSGATLALAISACGWQGGQQAQDAGYGGQAGDATAWAGGDPAAAGGDGGWNAGAPPPQMAPPPMLDTSRMQPAQIIDQGGFGQPMVAANLEIPVGWQTVGGVTWNDNTPCVTNQMQIGWTAMAPDSLTAVEILPGFSWQVAGTEIQMNPCPAAPYRSTREFLEATVQRARPGARVLDYEQLTGLEQQMAQAAQSNPQIQARFDAGRLLIGYSTDGVEMREVLSAAVTFTQAQGNIVGGTATIHAQRAPEGRMDMDLMQRIAGTMQPNPQWLQAMQQRGMENIRRFSDGQRRSIDDWHNRQMAIINARGAADRHAIRMRTNQEVAGIYNSIAASTSATSDNMHRRTMEGIGEYNSYSGAGGTTVQSSIHGGSRVFQGNSDPNQAYSTSDPYHNPSNATELERIP